MNAVLFPLAAFAVTFLILIPVTTIVSKTILDRRPPAWRTIGSSTTFLLIIAPTVLPLAWLTSSALHQNEYERILEICVAASGAAQCLDVVFLLGALAGLLGFVVWRATQQPRFRGVNCENEDRLARVETLEGIDSNSVEIVHGSPSPMFFAGWIHRRIVIDAAFFDGLDDDQLRAALLHERGHATHHDNLRNFLGHLALSLNPLGTILAPHLSSWRHGREIVCDEIAVGLGADRLALASAIVEAVKRTRSQPKLVSMLSGTNEAMLKIRIALLLDPNPAIDRTKSLTLSSALFAIAIVAAIVVPHIQTFDLLGVVHMHIEHFVH